MTGGGYASLLEDDHTSLIMVLPKYARTDRGTGTKILTHVPHATPTNQATHPPTNPTAVRR